MQRRVFIVHGWDGHPEEGWFPWLKRELEEKGFEVFVPAMPEPAKPTIESWVARLSELVGDVDENTFFVGHSIGCQTILRYMERLPADVKVGGAICVAGWFTLMSLKTDEEREIAREWLETPIDFEKVKRHSSHFFAVFSDDDPDVPRENQALFEQCLGAETALEHGRGHFSGGDGVKELPIVLARLLGP